MKFQMTWKFIHQKYVISGKKSMKIRMQKYFFSKMTFAHLSQATAASQRFYHRTRNTFNRIQNTFITTEIHEQGQFTGM